MLSLGIEFSTQSVKIVVLDVEGGHVTHTDGFEYEDVLPAYETQGGVLPSADPQIRHTSPFMLIEAMDLAFRRLIEEGIDLRQVSAVKIDAMQHCTVYADSTLNSRLSHLKPDESLVAQIRQAITRLTSPIWEDRSPVDEIVYLKDALKEKGGLTARTGNHAELRFPACQILKWARENPNEYRDTGHIFLLSAFLTSILAGQTAPVDTGDGWGTNLNHTDIHAPGWSADVLSAADDYLKQHGIMDPLGKRLGQMVPYDTPVGRISPYFSLRYGVYAEAVVLAGTGDNPATLLGCGGKAIISLGSSYTVNGVMKTVDPSNEGAYNMFGYVPGKSMALSVFTNGGRVHEAFFKKYLRAGHRGAIQTNEWEDYIKIAGEPALHRDEPLMLPYLLDESVPLRRCGIIRDGLDEDNPVANIRAVHVSQALALKIHSGHMSDAGELHVVGGGARNKLLRQLIADVFGSRVCSIQHAGFAAPKGCAISGARCLTGMSYEDAARRYVQEDPDSECKPDSNLETVKRFLLDRYGELEGRAPRC